MTVAVIIQADGPAAGAGHNPLGLFYSVVVVDARDNTPRTNGGSPNTALLPAASRGKRRLGGLAVANGVVTDNKKKVRTRISDPRDESVYQKMWTHGQRFKAHERKSRVR